VVTTPEIVLAEVQRDLPALLAPYPGVDYMLEGEQGRAAAGCGRSPAAD
jgi:hypothetical protein